MRDEAVVTVFGGSSPKPGEPAYQQAETLGSQLARAGIAVATGGYIGTMEAVSKGAAMAGGRVIGVTCDQIERWRTVMPNEWVQEEIRMPTLRDRVYKLIEIGRVLIALPGGVGTLSEIALAWSLLQTAEIAPRPLVLVGELWRKTLGTFLESAGGYLRLMDEDILTFVPDTTAAGIHVLQRLKSMI
jgi:uncharacterized protein (TIGR00730 family)